MRSKDTNMEKASSNGVQTSKNIKSIFSIIILSLLMLSGSLPASAHCDSYGGPTIKNAIKALETNNVNLVLKWITADQ